MSHAWSDRLPWWLLRDRSPLGDAFLSLIEPVLFLLDDFLFGLLVLVSAALLLLIRACLLRRRARQGLEVDI